MQQRYQLLNPSVELSPEDVATCYWQQNIPADCVLEAGFEIHAGPLVEMFDEVPEYLQEATGLYCEYMSIRGLKIHPVVVVVREWEVYA